MLSIEELRKTDSRLKEYSDEELTKIRDNLYELAELVLDNCLTIP